MSCGAPIAAKAQDSACPKTQSVFSTGGEFRTLALKLMRKQPIRVLAIGSSSTEGYGASSPAQAYPAQLEDDLSRAWRTRITVINAGKGGETANQTIGRLKEILVESKPDFVIWQVGTNDAVKGIDEVAFRALLEQGVTTVEKAGVEMMLLDQQFFPTIKDLAQYERFVATVRDVAEEHKISLFSRYAMMKQWNSGSSDDLRSMLATDGFHMGDRGYDCLAGRLSDEIETMVARSVKLAKSVADVKR